MPSVARVSLGMQAVNLIAVVHLPFLGLFAAALFLWGRGFSWVDLGLLLAMYVMTALGITVGYHQVSSRIRAFETNPVIQFIIGVFGFHGRSRPFAQVGSHAPPASPV